MNSQINADAVKQPRMPIVSVKDGRLAELLGFYRHLPIRSTNKGIMALLRFGPKELMALPIDQITYNGGPVVPEKIFPVPSWLSVEHELDLILE